MNCGYPRVMVLAEKIVTAIQRGTANTRWRDFVDIVALSDSADLTQDRDQLRGLSVFTSSGVVVQSTLASRARHDVRRSTCYEELTA